jgi:hypothetical protein
VAPTKVRGTHQNGAQEYQTTFTDWLVFHVLGPGPGGFLLPAFAFIRLIKSHNQIRTIK